MKSILISIKPKYVADILNGEKTIEIRKTMPKCDFPIDVYIYCSKGKKNWHLLEVENHEYEYDYYIGSKEYGCEMDGKVVAKFTLRKVEEIVYQGETYFTKSLKEQELMNKSRLNFSNIDCYLRELNGYAWHIDNLVIFDEPKELNEFVKCDDKHIRIGNCFIGFGGIPRLTKAPQSFMYIETEDK